jgi:divalent metal cation (Fe/Co/Zn/Cd) transporter
MVIGKTILGQLSGYAALLADAVENAGTNLAATLTTLLTLFLTEQLTSADRQSPPSGA